MYPCRRKTASTGELTEKDVSDPATRSPRSASGQKELGLVVKVFDIDDEEKHASALNEYKILKLLDHEHIVKCEDFFVAKAKSKAYLVMQNGGSLTLDQYICSQPEGKLPEHLAKQVVNQLLTTVQYMHF